MFKSEDRQENVSQVKIVACDSKLLTQWEMLIPSREYIYSLSFVYLPLCKLGSCYIYVAAISLAFL